MSDTTRSADPIQFEVYKEDGCEYGFIWTWTAYVGDKCVDIGRARTRFGLWRSMRRARRRLT